MGISWSFARGVSKRVSVTLGTYCSLPSVYPTEICIRYTPRVYSGYASTANPKGTPSLSQGITLEFTLGTDCSLPRVYPTKICTGYTPRVYSGYTPTASPKGTLSLSQGITLESTLARYRLQFTQGIPNINLYWVYPKSLIRVYPTAPRVHQVYLKV